MVVIEHEEGPEAQVGQLTQDVGTGAAGANDGDAKRAKRGLAGRAHEGELTLEAFLAHRWSVEYT